MTKRKPIHDQLRKNGAPELPDNLGYTMGVGVASVVVRIVRLDASFRERLKGEHIVASVKESNGSFASNEPMDTLTGLAFKAYRDYQGAAE